MKTQKKAIKNELKTLKTNSILLSKINQALKVANQDLMDCNLQLTREKEKAKLKSKYRAEKINEIKLRLAQNEQ